MPVITIKHLSARNSRQWKNMSTFTARNHLGKEEMVNSSNANKSCAQWL